MVFAYKKFGSWKPPRGQDMATHRRWLKFAEKLYLRGDSKLFDLLDSREVDNICGKEPKKESGGTVNVLADTLASVLAQMYERKYVKAKLISNCLRFCRDVVASQGYKETNEFHLHENYDGKPHIVLVAGCQNQKMMRNRMAAARYLLDILPAPISFVLSGLHSLTDVARIPDESMRMENLLWEGLPRQQNLMSKITNFNILKEAKSQHTDENIKQFLALKLLEKMGSANVTVVSSNFHLLRLAKIFEAKIGSRKKHINTLFLVGSEGLQDDLEDTSADVKYAKQVFFQLALYMFTELKNDGMVS